MKIAPIIHAIDKANNPKQKIKYRLIHTGQHYDANMSETFFQQLEIPKPAFNLNVGSGTQAEQTAGIMVGYENLLRESLLEHPNINPSGQPRTLVIRNETPQEGPSDTSGGCRLETYFPEVSFGDHVQVLGINNITIGKGSCIGDNTWLNICVRDESIRMRIGSCVLVGRQGMISTGGYLEIGDYCVFAPRVYISDADHIFTDIMQPILQQGATINRSVIVEENCWLGINTVISGNLTIGRGSVVGANAVVTRDVHPFSVVAGNPGQIIKMYSPRSGTWERTRSANDIQRILDERREIGLPSREEYQVILSKNALITQLDPVLSGRGHII